MNKVQTGLLVSVLTFITSAPFSPGHALAGTTQDEISRGLYRLPPEQQLLMEAVQKRVSSKPALTLFERKLHYETRAYW